MASGQRRHSSRLQRGEPSMDGGYGSPDPPSEGMCYGPGSVVPGPDNQLVLYERKTQPAEQPRHRSSWSRQDPFRQRVREVVNDTFPEENAVAEEAAALDAAAAREAAAEAAVAAAEQSLESRLRRSRRSGSGYYGEGHRHRRQAIAILVRPHLDDPGYRRIDEVG